MTSLILSHRRPNGTRDPFALARELFSFDAWPRVGRFPELALESGGFSPRFDVVETDDALVIKADLPGVAQDAVEIAAVDRTLKITGSRSTEDKREGKNYHLVERAYGSFARSFALADNVDPDRIAAKLKDGVLAVTVPKKAEAKPRTIEIGVA